MSIYKEIAEDLGELVTKKNEAYGSSFAKAGEFLKLLYPHGLSVDEFEDALLLVRVFDKMMRIATDRDALGECPWQDLAGYGILGVSLCHERKEAGTVSVTQTEDTAPFSPDLSQGLKPWLIRNAAGLCAVCTNSLPERFGQAWTFACRPEGNHVIAACSTTCQHFIVSFETEHDGGSQ